MKKYPFARIDQFKFWVDIDRHGELRNATKTMFVGDGDTKLYNLGGTYWKYSWDVTSNVFRRKYASALFFGPTKIWNPKVPFKRTLSTLPFNLFEFKAFLETKQVIQPSFLCLRQCGLTRKKVKTLPKSTLMSKILTLMP